MIALGDSHITIFDSFVDATCMIPKASARGMSSSSSDTKDRETFLKFLKDNRGTPIINLGGVDCTTMIYRKDMTLPRYLLVSTNRYFQFLNLSGRKFIVSSVILPIITNSTKSDLVILFNIIIRHLSEKYGHYFLDITSPIIDSKGIVKKEFINSPTDLQLNHKTITPIIERELNKNKGFWS